METKIDEFKKAHKKIIRCLEKNRDYLFSEPYELGAFGIDQIKTALNCRYTQHLLSDVYGLNLHENFRLRSTTYAELKDYCVFIEWGKNNNITWSYNKEQPKIGEKLICFSFPTGAFVFGSSYPKGVFYDFFDELKEYEPKYRDDVNRCLYFSVEKSKDVFNNFEDIFKKHKERVIDYNQQERIRQIEEELKVLKGAKND